MNYEKIYLDYDRRRVSMTAAQLSRFVRDQFPSATADNILARMHNGASFRDAVGAAIRLSDRRTPD